MRTFGVELAHEGVETLLLLQAVGSGRTRGFLFEREMHPLVTAVLLRSSRPDPPPGQFGEIEQRIGAGEGHAVVGADCLGQAAVAEQPLERRDGRVLAGGLQGFAQQQEPGGVIGYRERIAIAAVAKLELALEVRAPQVIRRRAIGQRRAARTMTRVQPEDIGDRTYACSPFHLANTRRLAAPVVRSYVIAQPLQVVPRTLSPSADRSTK